jgi:methionyl-tRNA formyltransferase
MEKLRIIFMGTPEFAVGILDTIIKNNYDVVGVITAADKPAGRGQKIKYSAVKEYAPNFITTNEFKRRKFFS